MDNKTSLRIRAKSIRKNLDITSLSNIAVQKIRDLTHYKTAKNVLIFYPLKYEMNVLDLLKDNKNFYLPKVFEDELLVCPFCDKLEKSDLNIYEPCSEPINPKIIDLIIVPALMVDKNNYRLGYGGGFYDRFLASNPQIVSVLPISKELIVENLPIEEFDIPIDYVISC